MKRIMTYLACLGMFALANSIATAQTAPATKETQEANLKAYIELLRKDLKKEKVSILTELMELDPQESSKFWPVYNEYDKALTKLADERIVFIRMYAENFDSLNDQTISKIATGLMDIESKRVELRKQYFQRISQTLSPKDALRWLHIEAQIERIVDLQILSSLPIAE